MCYLDQITIHMKETMREESMYFQDSQVVLDKGKLLDLNLSYSKTLVSLALASKVLTHLSREEEEKLIPSWIKLILSQKRHLVKALRSRISKLLNGKWPLTSRTHTSLEFIA